MNAKKEKLPIESEVQPLKEEELDDVSGGAPSRHIEQIVARGGRKMSLLWWQIYVAGGIESPLEGLSQKAPIT